MNWFVGINIPWFGAHMYGHDIGYNQLFPGTIPYLNTNLKEIQNQFGSLNGAAKIIRIWLFEGLEGLMFSSSSSFSPQDIVTGIDKSAFIPNVCRILTEGEKNGFQVYFTLFNSWDVEYPPQPAKRSLLLNIINDPRPFITNALSTLLSNTGQHPSISGIDIMNEANGLLSGGGGRPVVSEPLFARNFITPIASEIKRVNKNLAVTTSFSSNQIDLAMSFANSTDLLPVLNIIDIHAYHPTTTDIINYFAKIEDSARRHNNKKAIILGEIGDATSIEKIPKNAEQEINLLKTYLDKALDVTYINGILLWALDYFIPSNKQRIIDLLASYM